MMHLVYFRMHYTVYCKELDLRLVLLRQLVLILQDYTFVLHSEGARLATCIKGTSPLSPIMHFKQCGVRKTVCNLTGEPMYGIPYLPNTTKILLNFPLS